MIKYRFFSVVIVLVAVAIGVFVYQSEIHKEGKEFKYGLDLSGGSHLVYRADTSNVLEDEVANAMEILRRTIERRVNIFGVSEPLVQVEKGGAFSNKDDQNRLIVELPGVTDLDEALNAIGETPLLEFKLQTTDPDLVSTLEDLDGEDISNELFDQIFIPTGLTGRQLESAGLVFDNTSGRPLVTLEFNKDGQDLLSEITRNNIGNIMAIFLDGEIVSAPVIQTEIIGGTAQINGDFGPEEARDLANNLNFGALPVPIELISTQTIGATLGSDTLSSGVKALVISIFIIFAFLILYYRLPGLLASVSLIFYLLVMLALFKLVPVVLTASGIAGFILSIGMAVDANILIFERLKEELDRGKSLREAIKDGFSRAWPSIRDGNTSSILAAAILFWFSGTSLIKGFALVFGLGVLVSMISAVLVSRTLLMVVSTEKLGDIGRFVYSKGFAKVVVSKEQ
jgi:preprotein translocase subunit SecD